MVKNRAEKTSVDVHTYQVSSKPQCEIEKIHGGILEKNDVLDLFYIKGD